MLYDIYLLMMGVGELKVLGASHLIVGTADQVHNFLDVR